MEYELSANKGSYNDHDYDSDQEKNWAVFFDRTGIKYTPHPGKFRTGEFYIDARTNKKEELIYSPDFFLRDYGYFCEVKATNSQLLSSDMQRKLSAAIKENFTAVGKGLLILGPMNGFSSHASKKLSLSGDFYSWCGGSIVKSYWNIGKAESGETKTKITLSEPDRDNDSILSSYPFLPRNSSVKLYGDFDCASASEIVYKALFEAIYAKRNGLYSDKNSSKSDISFVSSGDYISFD